uniref:F-box domain-containing protein n=1 Tax=Oryza nivara TaxID=4536 RepID=A0A0E0I818_ORYNI
MDALPAPSPEKTTTRDWSELPVDALSVVFAKLGAVEVLMGAGLVCRPWLDATKLPHLWRCVDIAAMKKKRAVLCVMADEAVKRADGQLEAFMAGAFVTNKLLKHVGDSSPTLKRLWLESCSLVTSNGLAQMIAMAPLLEELVLSYCRKVRGGGGGGGGVYAAVAEACPRLRRLEIRRYPAWRDDDGGGDHHRRRPLGIAAMRELRHLTLVGVAGAGDDELAAIVDGGCPHLEVLHVSECPGLAAVDVAALRAKCGGVKCGGFTPASRPPMTTSRRLRRRKSGDRLATAGPTGSTTGQIGPPENLNEG